MVAKRGKVNKKSGLPLNSNTFLIYSRGCLGVVYIMDHKVVSRSYTICDWLLNSFGDYFRLHQEKNVRVMMEFKVPNILF